MGTTITGSILKNPFFWTTLISTSINVLLYLINRNTFKLLYQKPIFEIIKIATDKDHGIKEIDYGNPDILIDIKNPSSNKNIVNFSLKTLFPFKSIDDNSIIRSSSRDRDIDLKAYKIVTFFIALNDENIKKYKNKNLVLSLTDLSGRISWRMFEFTQSK